MNSERISGSSRSGSAADTKSKDTAKDREKNHSAGALEASYRRFAEGHGAGWTSGNSRLANRNHDKLVALLPKLRATADRGAEILRRLMKDPSDAVAMCAATHSLPISEAEALATLRAIARKGGVMGFNAETVIKEWKSGRLTIG